jgi:Protein of unknown function (DUF1571)
MLTRTDVVKCASLLLLSAAFFGCEDAFLDRYGHPVAQAPARALPADLRASNDLPPGLRISNPQAATAPASRTDANIPVQSSQAAAQPPIVLASDHDAAGPPLKDQGGPGTAATDSSVNRLRTLYREAAERYAGINSYIVRLRRREQVNGRDRPEELLLVKFRKNPWSIYFKWLGKEANGREVVYVRGQYEDKIHTLLAAGDMPLMPAGKQIALAPDNALVRSSSRHSIHEAGIGSMIDHFGEVVAAAERAGPRASTRYAGVLSRSELTAPCDVVDQSIPAGSEALLPRGGRRLWFFDSSNTRFPVLLITQDETGHEVEYYCYDRFLFPVDLDDKDFDPSELWKSSKPAEPRPAASR